MMKYVIIGNSAAGIGAVEGIRRTDKQGEITVITNEPYHTYSRPLISYLLLGKVSEEGMKYRGGSFYADNDCTLLANTAVTGIDAAKKLVFADGKKIPYDKLLVASGSSPFVPPFEGLDTVKDKCTFMSLDDAKKLDTLLGQNKRVLIIGAGLIGLKCAEGIHKRVKHITVLDLAPRILSSILDDDGAKMVQAHLES
jgi:NAD(P)H-nitrite reductase large subunit